MIIECTPRFDNSTAARIAREQFEVVTTASPLPSERDQNFALVDESGSRYVLKIAKSDEEHAVLDLQNSALRHVKARRPNLATQTIVPALDGSDIVVAQDTDGRRFFVRLMTWVEGDIFVHTNRHDAALLMSLGASLAELDMALADFRHPAMHRVLQWDLKRIGQALDHLHLLSKERHEIIEHFRIIWPNIRWGDLRTTAIHGDANDYNILVNDGVVCGFLDFGDMVHSATVCDLAIAMAYAVLDQVDPVAAAVTIASAYHKRFPLTTAEIESLYPLMTSRLCMSVCYAAYNSIVKSEDKYQTVSAAPAWTLLERLAGTSHDSIVSAFRDAFI